MDSDLPPGDQWLPPIIRSIIMPTKWVLWALVIILILVENFPAYPSLSVAAVTVFYGLSNLFLSYIFYCRRYSPKQLWGLEYGSLATDLVIISLLVVLENLSKEITSPGADYYLLFFLVVLRGIVIFPTRTHAFVMNSLVCVAYVFTAYFSQQTLGFLSTRSFLIHLTLLWGLMLLSWFIVEILRQQRLKITEDMEKIRQIEANLSRTEKLASMGEIAAGIAHEINNPIGIITATTDLLRRQLPADSPSHRQVNIILQESERCRRLVAELMRLSTPSALTLEPIEIPKLVEDSISLIREKIREAHVTVDLQFEDNLPPLPGNKTLLQRVLLNLIQNALQAMPNGGKLRIEVKYKEQLHEIVMKVADTGVGIEAESIEKIFSPFYSTCPGQSGLGLTMVHRIIDWHHGHIRIQSQPGEGTVFEIDIPLG